MSIITVNPTTRSKGFKKENLHINNNLINHKKIKKKIDDIGNLKLYNLKIEDELIVKKISHVKNC